MCTLSLSLSFRLRDRRLTQSTHCTGAGACLRLALLLAVSPLWAQPAKQLKPGALAAGVSWKDFVAARDEAQALLQKGQREAAVEAVEDFLRAHPTAHQAHPGGLAMLAGVASQEDPTVGSPLKDVPLPHFVAQLSQAVDSVAQAAQPVNRPPTATGQRPVLQPLVAAAGGNLHAQINAHLALNDLDTALQTALDFMRDAGTKDEMARSLADVARCFKAKDLNLLRANQFLEFQKTGQGENPLPGF